MTKQSKNGRYDVQEIKRVARGRWLDVLTSVTTCGDEVFSCKAQPCPKCGGTDRFTAHTDVKNTGGLFCRHCHNGDTRPKSGDGIAAVQWLNDCTFPEALALIADAVGLASIDPANDTRDIISDLCKQKRMPVNSAKTYGAEVATRGRTRVVRFPVHGADGEPVSYSDVSPYSKGQLAKGMLPKNGTHGVFLPGVTPKPGETWLIVEGPKDPAALHGMGYLAAGLTGCKLPLQGIPAMFTGCDVVLVPDLDRPAFRATVGNGEALLPVANTVKVARLPGDIKPKGGDDVRDIIARDGTDAVRLAIDSAEAFDADALIDRPSLFIDIERPETEIVDLAIKILANRGFDTDDRRNRIYQRGSKLVCVADSGTGPHIATLTQAGIRERITAAMDLATGEENDDGPKPQRPPKWITQAIYDRPEYRHVRRLDGIVTSPVLRPDGSLLQTPGYDAATRLVYLPDGEYPTVLASPTKQDAVTGVKELMDLVADFPFKNDAAKSVWLANVLTLLARSAIVGCCPMFCYSANIRGSGKSKLCDIASIVAYGKPMARKTLPLNDEETRKVITAIALEAKPCVLLDNIDSNIGSPSLDAALTSETWNDRILGKSETTGDLPLSTVFVATGNNLAFQADTARRVMLSELESMEETPEDRTDFQHDDIEAFTRDNRHRLAVAGLTILRAFVVSGRPYDGKRLGSFVAWSELISGAIRWMGITDPMETVMTVREQDRSGNLLRLLLDALDAVAGTEGITSREIDKKLKNDSLPITPADELLKAAFAEIINKPTARNIGATLRKHKGRICGRRRLVAKPGRANLTRWAVESMEQGTRPLSNVEKNSTATSIGFNAGFCDDCGEALQPTPTHDGYLNRHCGPCGKDYSSVPMPVNVAKPTVETRIPELSNGF